MDTQAIFGLQFVMSLFVWGLIAKWWLAPWCGGGARAYRSSHRLGWDVGAGVTLQHCRRGGPYECTEPRGCSTACGCGLVHPDVLGTSTSGNSLADICPAAQTRALNLGN